MEMPRSGLFVGGRAGDKGTGSRGEEGVLGKDRFTGFSSGRTMVTGEAWPMIGGMGRVLLGRLVELAVKRVCDKKGKEENLEKSIPWDRP